MPADVIILQVAELVKHRKDGLPGLTVTMDLPFGVKPIIPMANHGSTMLLE